MHNFRNYPWVFLTTIFASVSSYAAPPSGYYRQPALHGETIVFVSEGDLWKVSINGGAATRLTTHPGEESHPAFSPDGRTLAFLAQYEGPTEVYTMPLSGGPPERRTFEAGRIPFVGWTPSGKILYATDTYATLPSTQLVTIEIGTKSGAGVRNLVPLAQAADGAYDDSGKTLFFTRLPFQGSHTKRYRGGTAQTLWKFTAGAPEAVPLSAGYAGTSKTPMWWQGRVYFSSDRDGTMNLWSMDADGADLKQHTRHAGWDVAYPSLSGGKIVYQLGADIHLYDIATDADHQVAITTLGSDFDQTRELWVKKPLDYLTTAHLAPDGGRVALTARGRVFVAPRRQGRLVEITRTEGVRYRDARFFPAAKPCWPSPMNQGRSSFGNSPPTASAQRTNSRGTAMSSAGKGFHPRTANASPIATRTNAYSFSIWTKRKTTKLMNRRSTTSIIFAGRPTVNGLPMSPPPPTCSSKSNYTASPTVKSPCLPATATIVSALPGAPTANGSISFPIAI